MQSLTIDRYVPLSTILMNTEQLSSYLQNKGVNNISSTMLEPMSLDSDFSDFGKIRVNLIVPEIIQYHG
jgi:hypothetical protein